jgi:hypothetical protein
MRVVAANRGINLIGLAGHNLTAWAGWGLPNNRCTGATGIQGLELSCGKALLSLFIQLTPKLSTEQTTKNRAADRGKHLARAIADLATQNTTSDCTTKRANTFTRPSALAARQCS